MPTSHEQHSGRGMNVAATLYFKACHAWPAFRRGSRRVMYRLLARYAQQRDWTFMNYGYAPLTQGETQPALDPADEPNRYSIQLYNHLAASVDLHDLRVLEVGSGRGGGASYLLRALRPAEMVGVDFSEPAVALCHRLYDLPGLRFVHGDAEDLPFEDGSFDVVVNVESSHCYGSVPQFLSQVARVLRPGGYLLFADFRRGPDLALLDEQLTASGMATLRQADITPNVLSALALDEARRSAQIRAAAPRWLVKLMGEFAGLQGSRIQADLASGAASYVSYVLQKAAVQI